jgi:hypothetical protein
MRRARLILVPALVLSGGLVLSACGGDSSPEVPIVVPTETTSTAGALAKDDFIQQADAVCEEANTAIEQFAASGQGLTEAGQIADLRSGVVDELKSLGPPDEDRTTLDQFISAMESEVEAGQKIALAQERGEDTAQFEAELDTAKTDAEQAASQYGFSQCGQSISASSTTDTTGGAVVPSAPSTSAPSTGGSTGTGGGTTGGGGSTGGGGGTGGTGGAGGVGPG